jgi:3-isopropylmalate dehydratase small subunit
VIQAPQISIKVEEGDILELEVDNGKITNTRTNEMILFDPFPDFIQAYIDEGGLANYVRKRLIKKS